MWEGNVDAYLRGAFKDVGGWCLPQLWRVIQPLRVAMAADGCEGPIAEIGVYHGKFFIGLVKTMGAPAGNLAIDVFDMQRFNLDGAGDGNLAQFEANLARCGVDRAGVRSLRADSMTLTAEEVAALRPDEGGGFAMFSVDGCHMAEHTINDIRIAMALTRPEGLIFVDDYYNPDWPGVQEGVAKLYLTDAPRFVPLAYSCNKLILCHLSFHKTYLDALGAFLPSAFPQARLKRQPRFGYPTLTVSPEAGASVFVRI